MNKLAIVYWSGTGNTETMANCIAEGAREAGAEVALMGPAAFSAAGLTEYQVVALRLSRHGCRTAGGGRGGTHVLRAGRLSGKQEDRPVRLLRLGDGQWMRDWCARAKAAGADLYDEEGLIANESPNEEAREACRDLGRSLAAW